MSDNAEILAALAGAVKDESDHLTHAEVNVEVCRNYLHTAELGRDRAEQRLRNARKRLLDHIEGKGL